VRTICPNTSKHVELFKAFGVPLPVYAHIPLILKQNGPGKDVEARPGGADRGYQRRGYLPEALVNFLCLLGWNPGGDREKMRSRKLSGLFDLPGVNQSNAPSTRRSSRHEHACLLERRGSFCGAGARLFPAEGRFAPSGDDGYLRECCFSASRDQGDRELAGYTAYFFTEEFAVDPKAPGQDHGQRRSEGALRGLRRHTRRRISHGAILEQALQQLPARNGLQIGDYIHPAVCGIRSERGRVFYGLLRVLGPSGCCGGLRACWKRVSWVDVAKRQNRFAATGRSL